MRVLKTDVHVDLHSFKAGTAESDIPADVEISNPNAWTEVEEEGSDFESEIEWETLTTLPSQTELGPVTDSIPNRLGPGSSRALWATYAASHGIEVDSSSNREEIIRILQTADIPIE